MPETLGLEFKEVMSGGFLLECTNPEDGERKGDARGSKLTMHCEVSIADLDRFTRDLQHPGILSGTIDFTPFGNGLVCDPGTFNLFRPGDAPQEKWMVYEFGFTANRQRYCLAGKKIVRQGQESEVLKQTTTLYTLLHQGENRSAPVAGAGIVHLGAKSIADLVKTVRVTNTHNSFDTLQGLVMYSRLFLGELWHTYV